MSSRRSRLSPTNYPKRDTNKKRNLERATVYFAKAKPARLASQSSATFNCGCVGCCLTREFESAVDALLLRARQMAAAPGPKSSEHKFDPTIIAQDCINREERS